MREDLDKGRIQVGEDLGQIEYRLMPSRILQYLEATNDDCQWYRTDSPFGGIIAPPTIFDQDFTRPGLWKWWQLREPQRPGPLLAVGYEWEFLNPARPGMKITVKSKLADKYFKRGRTYAVCQVTNEDENGTVLSRIRFTICWPTTGESSSQPEPAKEPEGSSH